MAFNALEWNSQSSCALEGKKVAKSGISLWFRSRTFLVKNFNRQWIFNCQRSTFFSNINNCINIRFPQLWDNRFQQVLMKCIIWLNNAGWWVVQSVNGSNTGYFRRCWRWGRRRGWLCRTKISLLTIISPLCPTINEPYFDLMWAQKSRKERRGNQTWMVIHFGYYCVSVTVSRFFYAECIIKTNLTDPFLLSRISNYVKVQDSTMMNPAWNARTISTLIPLVFLATRH